MMVSQKVITPAKAWVHGFVTYLKDWIPAFDGMTQKRLSGLFASASSNGLKVSIPSIKSFSRFSSNPQFDTDLFITWKTAWLSVEGLRGFCRLPVGYIRLLWGSYMKNGTGWAFGAWPFYLGAVKF